MNLTAENVKNIAGSIRNTILEFVKNRIEMRT